MADQSVQRKGTFTLDRRKVLLGLGLAAASGVAQARLPVPNRPRIETEDLIALVPDEIDGFRFNTESGLVLPPSDALSDRLYDNLVTRTYSRSDGMVLMLLIAYNNQQDGVVQIHRPEICYPAGGFTLSETQLIDIPVSRATVLPGQIFTARSDLRSETVAYWTRIGDQFPRRWLDQRLAVAEANLRGVVPDGVLVRVSTLTGNMAAATPVLEGFVSDLYRRSPSHLRKLLYDRT